MRRLFAASVALLLGACGQLLPNSETSETGSTPEAVAEQPNLAPSETANEPVSVVLPLPDWAVQFIGRPFAEAFPNQNKNCMGSTYKVDGEDKFLRITGWSWDKPAGRAYDRLVSVSADGLINGAGTTVRDRPDVPLGTNGVVTDPFVGFDVVSAPTSGRLSIAAIGPDDGAFCWIKHIDL